MGNDEAALAGFERYLTLDPNDPFVQYQMGEIWLDRGDLSRAESLFKRALEVDPSVVAAKNALGVIALQRGDAVTAERLINEALAAKPTLRLAHFNLALLAEQRGDVRTAEREYVEELKQHPENYKSAFNLSRLYEQVGDRDGQINALKQSIVSNPRFAEGHFFLAKAYLDSGSHLDEAARLALKGLDLAPRSEYAPLGHYVLADVYNREGRARDAAQELARGRALEAQDKRRGPETRMKSCQPRSPAFAKHPPSAKRHLTRTCTAVGAFTHRGPRDRRIGTRACASSPLRC